MSAAQREMVDTAILANLSPFNEMSSEQFHEAATRVKIKQFKKGEYLFREGHSDRHTFYVIKGRIALLNETNLVETIAGDTEEAAKPLAANLPRKFTARVQSTATIAMIDTSVLDFHLGKNTADAYEVNDIHTEDDNDWMTCILQSEAFSKLPPVNLQKMLSGVSEAAYKAGATVIEQSQQTDYYFIVKSGVCYEAGNPSKEWRCGDAFGAAGLLLETGQPEKIIMKSSGQLMLLPKTDFLQFCYKPLISTTDSNSVQEQINSGCKWLDLRPAIDRLRRNLRESICITLTDLSRKINSLNNSQAYIVVGETPEHSGVGAFLLIQYGLNAFSYNENISTIDSSFIDVDAVPSADTLNDLKSTILNEQKLKSALESEKQRLLKEVASLKANKSTLTDSDLGKNLSLVDDHTGNPAASATEPAISVDSSKLFTEKVELENKLGVLTQKLTNQTEKRKLAENNYTTFLKKVKRYKFGNDRLIKKLKIQIIEGNNKLTKSLSQSESDDTNINQARVELGETTSQLQQAQEHLQNEQQRISELEAALTQARNNLDNVGQEFEASDDNEKVRLLQEKLKASSEEKRTLEEQLKSATEDYEALQNEHAEAALWDEMEDLHSALGVGTTASDDLNDLSDMFDDSGTDDLDDLELN